MNNFSVFCLGIRSSALRLILLEFQSAKAIKGPKNGFIVDVVFKLGYSKYSHEWTDIRLSDIPNFSPKCMFEKEYVVKSFEVAVWMTIRSKYVCVFNANCN